MNDILLDSWDLMIENGDFKQGDAHLQRQELLVATGKNDWKRNPTMGVGAEQYIDEDNDAALLSEIREQFRMDGMAVKLAQTRNGEIYINA